MARSILVFSVVICAVVCALNSGEAQPPSSVGLPTGDLDNALIATPPSTPAPRLVPTLAPPAYAPHDQPAYGTPASYGHDEIQSLRQQFIALAQKSAERMDAPELKQSIAEMRRLNVISELKILADEPQVRFHGTRAEIAAMVLKTTSQAELESTIRGLAKELEAKIRGSEPRDAAPQPREGTSDDALRRRERPE